MIELGGQTFRNGGCSCDVGITVHLRLCVTSLASSSSGLVLPLITKPFSRRSPLPRLHLCASGPANAGSPPITFFSPQFCLTSDTAAARRGYWIASRARIARVKCLSDVSFARVLCQVSLNFFFTHACQAGLLMSRCRGIVTRSRVQQKRPVVDNPLN